MRVSVAVIACLICPTIAARAQAPSWHPPAESERCPSKWGAADERGSANHMKPETVLRAAKLIRTGTVVELGRILEANMPFSGTRRFDLHTKRTQMNPQSNRRGSNEEIVISEIGQVGTQFDGFAHQTVGDKMYNCVPVDPTATRAGFSKLGVQNVGTLFTRGVLIDVAAFKGVAVLAPDYQITPEDLQGALARQNLKLQPGDAVLFYTGHGQYWAKDNDRFMRASPGLGVAAAEWLAKQDPMLVGADNPSIDVSPNPDAALSLPVHQIMLVVNGIHLLENLKLDELAARRVYEFALIVEPLKIQGGTGSTVAPVAVY